MDIETIFAAAIAVDSAAERATLLDQLCANDDDVRRQVEALLRHHDHPASFLERPELSLLPTLDGESSSVRLGRRIGPYKLREQLAEGGMGVVYVAEQEVPVRRKVALKIIKPGMATKDIVARFEAERQALAMMDHPNIARVFDGGETDAGQPYFVMELVPGSPITDFCDDQKLSTRERVQLLLDVCRAVQHAHQKGVIHRDLKPSNILVAEIDGAARAKVIDFGVAKAVSQKLSEQSLYTNVSQMIGTPLYMSPEQAAVGVVDVDTRSDVYSLGVLLYELLTGQTPFNRESLRQADFDEMRRIIREVEPSRPSALVSTLQGQILSTTADRRRSDPRTLCHSLRGELDWIAMKALEKDRNRRYESASALAADLERYLSDQPVSASPPSATYRLRKYARRHKAQLVTATAVLVVMIVASVVSSALAAWAIHERRLVEQEQQKAFAQYQRAEANHQRAEANLQLSLEALDEVYFRLLETRLTEKPVLSEQDEEFLERALPLYQQLAEQKGDEPEARLATARAYLRVGSIQHQLERYGQAEHAIGQAVNIAQELVANYPSVLDHSQLLLEGQLALADAVSHGDRLDDAEPILKAALQRSQQLSDAYSNDNTFRLLSARGCCALGELLKTTTRLEDAVEPFERAIEIYRELLRSDTGGELYRRELSTTLSLFGDLLMQLGRRTEAETMEQWYAELQAVTATQDEEMFQDQQSLADSRQLLALRLQKTKQYQQAEEVCRQSLEIQDRLIAERPHVADYRHARAETLTNLGSILSNLERFEEAQQSFTRALDSLEVLVEWWPSKRVYREQLCWTNSKYGSLLVRNDRLEEAESVYRQNLPLEREMWAEEESASAGIVKKGSPQHSRLRLGDVLKATGRDQEAAQQWHQALSQVAESYVDYKVRITTPGLYRLYLRGGGHAWHDDSAFVRILELSDGPSGSICDWYFFDLPRDDQAESSFHDWRGDAGFEAENSANSEAAVWRLLQPGHYTIRFSDVDDGVAIDTLVLQLATLSPPRGDGPDESPKYDDGVFLESGGRVVVEAEHFVARKSGRKASSWIVVPTESDGDPAWDNFRGPGYIQLKRNQEVADVDRVFVRAPLPQQTLGNWDLDRYSRLIEEGPDDYEPYFLRARAYEKLEQLERAQADNRQALTLLAAAVQEDSEDPEPYRRRAKHFFDRKDYQKAVEDYLKLVELCPDDAELWSQLGLCHHCLQRDDKAIAAFTESLRRNPNPKRYIAYNNRGVMYVEKGENDKAIADLTAAIRLDPQRNLAYCNRGSAYGQKGDLDKAIADFNEAIRLNPNGATAYTNRGMVYSGKGELDKAIADCTEAIRIDPHFAAAYNVRGNAYKDKGELETAIADYTEAIRLDPANYYFYSNRGSIYDRLKRYDDALADLNKLIELRPDDLIYYKLRSNTLEALGKHEEAIADATTRISIAPENPSGYNQLAWLLVTCSDPSFWDPSRAVTLASKAVELSPGKPEYWGTLGTAQYRAGDYREAIQSLNKTNQLDTQKKAPQCRTVFLAMAYWQLSEFEKARHWYDEFERWWSENEPTDEDLIRFRAEAKVLFDSDSESRSSVEGDGQVD